MEDIGNARMILIQYLRGLYYGEIRSLLREYNILLDDSTGFDTSVHKDIALKNIIEPLSFEQIKNILLRIIKLFPKARRSTSIEVYGTAADSYPNRGAYQEWASVDDYLGIINFGTDDGNYAGGINAKGPLTEEFLIEKLSKIKERDPDFYESLKSTSYNQNKAVFDQIDALNLNESSENQL